MRNTRLLHFLHSEQSRRRIQVAKRRGNYPEELVRRAD